MNINIYYGGRGLIDDPTLYVLSRVQEVLEELGGYVNRYNLVDLKSSISNLPQTLKSVDGIILAASVEWHGIGGYMQEFLDACWLYGDKEKISRMYMAPVIISTTYGEREALLDIENAWELLGGKLCSGICAYVDNLVEFKSNKEYEQIIAEKAENIYRSISEKRNQMPSSNHVIRKYLLKETLVLAPQEAEQLSRYVSDDDYLKRQKEDVNELTLMFKGILNKQDINNEESYIKKFEAVYIPQENFSATYSFIIDDIKKTLVIEVDDSSINLRYEKRIDADVLGRLKSETLQNIVSGRMTFQRAFMTGEMTAKGNFKTLRTLDIMFPFAEVV